NTLVLRNGLGSFAAQDIDLNGNLLMKDSTATVGNVLKAGTRFIHNIGNANTFVGKGAGNLTMTGLENSGFGTNALNNIINGSLNVAVGKDALLNNISGNNNTAVGADALATN